MIRATMLGFATSLALATGCLKPPAFECQTSDDCGGGICEPVGYCSFADGSCSGGQRFGNLSGPYANQCVGETAGDAGVDSPTDGPPVFCPSSYAALPNVATHVYRRLPDSATWIAQRDACGADSTSAYLAVPDDATELSEIITLAGGSVWVGIEDMVNENSFVTVFGSPATYLPWAMDQPDDMQNSDCVAALNTSLEYDDRKCNNMAVVFLGVCECEP